MYTLITELVQSKLQLVVRLQPVRENSNVLLLSGVSEAKKCCLPAEIADKCSLIMRLNAKSLFKRKKVLAKELLSLLLIKLNLNIISIQRVRNAGGTRTNAQVPPVLLNSA